MNSVVVAAVVLVAFWTCLSLFLLRGARITTTTTQS